MYMGDPSVLLQRRKRSIEYEATAGHIDANDEDQIRRTNVDFQEDYRRRALLHREVYARYTKTLVAMLHVDR